MLSVREWGWRGGTTLPQRIPTTGFCAFVPTHLLFYYLILVQIAYQGRIYGANQYSVFANNVLIVGQKLRTSCQINLNKKKNLFVFVENEQILRHNTQFFHILSTLL